MLKYDLQNWTYQSLPLLNAQNVIREELHQHKSQKESGNNFSLRVVRRLVFRPPHPPPDRATEGGVKQRQSTSLQAWAQFFEPVNRPHGGDLLKADSHTPSAPAPAARSDILSHTIQRLVLFQDSHSALLPPPLSYGAAGRSTPGISPARSFKGH